MKHLVMKMMVESNNESVENKKQKHIINIKGYYTKCFTDSVTLMKTSDIRYGYGAIIFYGTEKELDEYLDYLVKNEGRFGFKTI